MKLIEMSLKKTRRKLSTSHINPLPVSVSNSNYFFRNVYQLKMQLLSILICNLKMF